jgi:hypothetical protein
MCDLPLTAFESDMTYRYFDNIRTFLLSFIAAGFSAEMRLGLLRNLATNKAYGFTQAGQICDRWPTVNKSDLRTSYER